MLFTSFRHSIGSCHHQVPSSMPNFSRIIEGLEEMSDLEESEKMERAMDTSLERMRRKVAKMTHRIGGWEFGARGCSTRLRYGGTRLRRAVIQNLWNYIFSIRIAEKLQITEKYFSRMQDSYKPDFQMQFCCNDVKSNTRLLRDCYYHTSFI